MQLAARCVRQQPAAARLEAGVCSHGCAVFRCQLPSACDAGMPQHMAVGKGREGHLAGLIPAFFPGCPAGRHLPSATHLCRPHASHQQPCLPLPSMPQAGMSSLNDFATTYMCQSLPFGGVKHSGFDRFAGIEGLRGMCIPKVGCYACVWGCCVGRWMRCQGPVQHGTCIPKACEWPWEGAQSAARLKSAQQLCPPLQLCVLQSVTNQLRMPDTLPHMPGPQPNRLWPRTGGPSRPPSRRCCRQAAPVASHVAFSPEALLTHCTEEQMC